MRNVMAVGAVLAAALAGCGRDAPETHPVAGKVVLVGGDAAQLAGHHVEAILDGDPAVRASGVIGPDGSFTLTTFHAGATLKGARTGRYQARLLAAEDDEDGKRLRKPPVAARYQKFATSGLSFEVPASGELVFRVTPR